MEISPWEVLCFMWDFPNWGMWCLSLHDKQPPSDFEWYKLFWITCSGPCGMNKTHPLSRSPVPSAQGTTLWYRCWHCPEVAPKYFRAEVFSKYALRIFTLVCSEAYGFKLFKLWTLLVLETEVSDWWSFRWWMSTIWTQLLFENVQWFNFWDLLLCLKKGLMQIYIGDYEKGSGGKCSKQNVTREVKTSFCFQSLKH